MTRRELENLRGLCFEIRTLALKSENPKRKWQVDWYKDYRHNPKGAVKTIEGYDDGTEDYNYIVKRLKSLKKKRLREIKKAEEFIDSVQDPIMRSILRLYYRDGFSQKQIAEQIGYSYGYVRLKITRFWRYQK